MSKKERKDGLYVNEEFIAPLEALDLPTIIRENIEVDITLTPTQLSRIFDTKYERVFYSLKQDTVVRLKEGDLEPLDDLAGFLKEFLQNSIVFFEKDEKKRNLVCAEEDFIRYDFTKVFLLKMIYRE